MQSFCKVVCTWHQFQQKIGNFFMYFGCKFTQGLKMQTFENGKNASFWKHKYKLDIQKYKNVYLWKWQHHAHAYYTSIGMCKFLYKVILPATGLACIIQCFQLFFCGSVWTGMVLITMYSGHKNVQKCEGKTFLYRTFCSAL